MKGEPVAQQTVAWRNPARRIAVRRIGRVVLMVAVALTIGAIGAATANYLGWRLATPSPTREEAVAALRTGLPDVPATEVGWHDDVHDVHFMEQPDADNLPGQQQANFLDGKVSQEAFDQARTRLTAAGWRTRLDTDAADRHAFFVASRGDLVMEWEFTPAGAYSQPESSLDVWLWRFTPTRVKALTVAGWLLGAVAGWWLVRSVRHLAHAQTRRRLLGVLGVITVVLGLSTLATAYFTVHDLLDQPARNGQPVALWIAYFPFLAPFGFRVG
jgi:hypothetical protein